MIFCFVLCCNVTSIGCSDIPKNAPVSGKLRWSYASCVCVSPTKKEIYPTSSWCASEENKAWNTSRALAAAQTAGSQDSCLRTRTLKASPPKNDWDCHETPICQYGEMEMAVSPMPTSPLQGKPLLQYLDFHEKEIPVQELKREGRGRGGNVLCSVSEYALRVHGFHVL